MSPNIAINIPNDSSSTQNSLRNKITKIKKTISDKITNLYGYFDGPLENDVIKYKKGINNTNFVLFFISLAVYMFYWYDSRLTFIDVHLVNFNLILWTFIISNTLLIKFVIFPHIHIRHNTWICWCCTCIDHTHPDGRIPLEIIYYFIYSIAPFFVVVGNIIIIVLIAFKIFTLSNLINASILFQWPFIILTGIMFQGI